MKAKARAEETVRRVLRELSTALVAQLALVAAEPDPVALHDLRVLLRRSRTVVTHAKRDLPEPARADAGRALREFAGCTGPARDLQVLLEGWELHASAVSTADPEGLARVATELERRRDDAVASAVRSLDELGTAAWMVRWGEWLDDPTTARGGGRRTGPAVADQVRRARRKVVRHGRAITPESPDEDLHQLRKDVKALRYLLEGYAALFPPGAVRRCSSKLRSLQDDLGAHQDAATHRTIFTWVASDLTLADARSEAVEAADLLRDDAGRRLEAHRVGTLQSYAAWDTPTNKKLLSELLRPLR